VEISSYPLFDHAPYALSLAVKMMEVAETESLICSTYIMLSRIRSARSWRVPCGAPAAAVHYHSSRNGYHLGRERPQLFADHEIFNRAIDGVTAISHYLKQRTLEDFDIKHRSM